MGKLIWYSCSHVLEVSADPVHSNLMGCLLSFLHTLPKENISYCEWWLFFLIVKLEEREYGFFVVTVVERNILIVLKAGVAVKDG